MSFHFPRVFPLVSDRSVWHNEKHTFTEREDRTGEYLVQGEDERTSLR